MAQAILSRTEAGFLKSDKPNEYRVRFEVSGEISMDIEADSLSDAREKALAMLSDEERMIELDEVTDACVGYIHKSPSMFLVNRSGRTMQVSRIEEGDVPREPDENGF